MRIFCSDYVCSYGEMIACGPVSFSLERGCCLAIRGINGAGKSSLLSALAGFPSPAVRGTLRFDGASLSADTKTRFRRGIALVPEGRHIFADLTVREHLLAAGAFLPSKERARRMAEAAEKIPLLFEMKNRKGGLLSGGQQQLLAIGRALMAKPACLLVDEPFLGLSPAATQAVVQLLEEEKKAGTTLLFTCQDDPAAEALADAALVLQCGRQLFFGPYEDGKDIPLMP